MKILLTNNHMANFGGSEIVTLELAEFLTSKGHDVLIYSPEIKPPLKISHIDHTSKKPDSTKFDLLWIHHNLLIHDLGFKKTDNQRMIFNHMSSYVGLEAPNNKLLEESLADIIFCNSKETKQALGIESAKLFQNPAPPSFDVKHTGKTRKPLYISNHRPNGLPPDADCIGINDEYRRVEPEDFIDRPYVVCNGKSVQYALRAGVPVFLYDHFGGPGWLRDSKTFWRAEDFNFSGRGFYPIDVLEEIRTTPPKAPPCAERFKLEHYYNLICDLK